MSNDHDTDYGFEAKAATPFWPMVLVAVFATVLIAFCVVCAKS